VRNIGEIMKQAKALQSKMEGMQAELEALEVEGSGAITVVDASRVQFTSMDQADGSEPVCIIGLQVHILTAGATFNLHTREASPGTLLPRKD